MQLIFTSRQATPIPRPIRMRALEVKASSKPSLQPWNQREKSKQAQKNTQNQNPAILWTAIAFEKYICIFCHSLKKNQLQKNI